MDTQLVIAIMAVAAVGISVVSVVFTAIFSVLQTKHNRNSVRPICEIKLNDYEDKISVYLANHGTGPLTILKIECNDGERSSSTLLSLMPKIEQFWSTFTEDITGWTIPVGGNVVLIELKPVKDEVKYRVRSKLSKISIRVFYTDIYGKTKFEKFRNLDFFARTLSPSHSYFGSNYDAHTKIAD